MPSSWNKLVKKVFDREKKKNPNFKLGDAMKMAAKERKRGGDGEAETNAPVEKTTEVKQETKTPDDATNAVAETKDETPTPSPAPTPAPASAQTETKEETTVVSGGKKTRKGGRRRKSRKSEKKRRGK